MKLRTLLAILFLCVASSAPVHAEAMLQLYNLTWNQIADKMPEIAEAGYTALWLPPPTKATSQFSAGYDIFDPFDLGDQDQNGTIPTRYGTKEELIHVVRVAHRFGIRVYLDNVMNHRGYSVPGYDANTPITIYPGLLPEDFHLQTTPDGFYRKWPNISDWNDVFQIQNHGFSDLIDLSQESPNANFGSIDGSTNPKLIFVRQPTHPEYYPDFTLAPIQGQSGPTVWHPFNGTNGVPVAEDTASYEIRAVLWELDQTKCDGFRLDAVKHVPSFFFGDYLSSTPNGYNGAIQTMFDYVHGYGYNNPISGYNEPDDNRNSAYDTEAVRNDAIIFGEHLGEPPSFDDYYNRGMRLEDINLHNNINNILGNPNGNSLSGYDGRDAGGFSSFDREMFVGTHDPGVVFTAQRAVLMAYFFMREGLPSLYSDGYYESANCAQCGGAFPAIAYAPFLGEFGDNKMPEVAYLHNQEARGGTIPRWSDQYTVAFERYDYREGSSQSSQVVSLFVMNDDLNFPGDIAFLDGINDSWPGSDPIPPGANGDAQGLAVDFPVGSVLYQLAASGPGANRAFSQITVRPATNSRSVAVASNGATVYVGSQSIPANGGAVELVVPSGGYVIYAYQGPQASRAGLKDAITIQQGGQDAPRMTTLRTDGPDGDTGWNPSYPFQMRGSIDQTGNIIGGTNVSNLTYAIDVPIITNSGPINLVLRADASTQNMLVKLDGGVDLNSQMGFGPLNQFTGTMLDLRDNRPGYTNDLYLGYEQAMFQFRYGPEKFAATNISRNVVVSLGAETYTYTIGGSATVTFGSGVNVNTSTAAWVYHNPLDTTDQGLAMRSPIAGGQAVTNWVKVGYQFNTTTGNIYYTTDGTAPEGSFGVAKHGTTTQVIPLQFSHTSSGTDGTYDWWYGIIPAQGSGTVTYKIAMYNGNVGTPISDADTAKLYGLTQFAITNFNPATALVWLHNDLNTNSTQVGLDAGFHMLRLRTFLPRSGQASVFNTFLQSFYYAPQPPSGVIAFPTNDGDTLGSQTYGVVVRAQDTTTEVDYHIDDNSANNDDSATGQLNGNGNGTNGAPSWAVATEVSPLPSIGLQYPNLPHEFRFNYVGIPSSGPATITVRLKDASSTLYTNHYTTLTRQVNCAAPSQVLNIAFPVNNGDTVSLDQNSFYEIVACFSSSLSAVPTNFTIRIDGSVQPRTSPTNTPLYLFQGSFCGNGTRDLRYDWSGMSAGQHLIEFLYDDGAVSLYASRIVNVSLTGVSASILQPPAVDPSKNVPPDTIVFGTCGGGAAPTNDAYTITVQTSTSVTNVLVSFMPTTNAFQGGPAQLSTNVGTALLWNFNWTNMVAGAWLIRADVFGGGSNTTFRSVDVAFRPIVPTNPNSDDSDNDGISDYLETTAQPLPSTNPDTWKNSDVHVYFFSGKTDPNSAHSDGDPNGLPDGLKLGIGPLPAATNTVTGLDPNCGTRNFIASLDPPLYNTLDNSTAPAGYAGYSPWPFNYNNPRTDQIAGTVLNPSTPDTDADGLRDAVEDMNHNGRVDITLTNSTGTPLTSTNGIAGLTYDTVTLSNANGFLVITGYGTSWQYPNMGGLSIPNGTAITTSIVVIAHPPTIYNTSMIDRTKVLQVWPGAVWLETDPNNPDTDGDGIPDGAENASGTGFLKIGLLNRNIGYNASSCGCPCVSNVTACVTNVLSTPLPPTILYWPLTSRVNRKALIQQYPNAILLETDPMDAHTDGDPNGLPDGWKTRYGLDPWDDGVIGHTNWHTGALITTNLNGAAGNPRGDGISNITKFLNGLDPTLFYSNGVAVNAGSLIVGSGATIGSTAGNTWFTEFQGWSVNDLKVVRPYDGIGPNVNNHTIYPIYDGFDWSRDLVAFYARDGGNDGNYYFRVDMHDLTFGADQNGRVSLYVAINIGSPGTGETTLPENVGATTDMGWHVLAAIYGQVAGSYAANLYVKLPGSGPGTLPDPRLSAIRRRPKSILARGP